MDVLRRLFAFCLVLFGMYSVVAWGAAFSDPFDQLVDMAVGGLPLEAVDYPGGTWGPVIVGIVAILIAYFVWPGDPQDDRRRDDD